MNVKEQIENEGFVILRNVISPELLQQLQAHASLQPPRNGQDINNKWWHPVYGDADEYNAEYANIQWKHYWTPQIDLNAATCVNEVATIVSPIIDEVLDNWQWWYMDYHVTNPGSDYIHAHVDTPHQFDEWTNPNNIVSLQTLVAIDDFTIENGATALVRKSQTDVFHNPDIADHKYDDYLKNNNTQFVAPAGSVLIYQARVLHSTMPNNSTMPRRALILNSIKDIVVPFMKKYGRE